MENKELLEEINRKLDIILKAISDQRINEKIKGVFGHAVPEEKRKEKIEKVLEFKPLNRDPIKITQEDLYLDQDEFKLWKTFNNRKERARRSTNIRYTDKPGLTAEEIKEIHRQNRANLKANLIKQIEEGSFDANLS